MSAENVRAFFKKLESDEAFRNEFMQNSSVAKGSADSIYKAAADAGFPFTKEELKLAKSSCREMSDEELDEVSGGGLSWGFCAYFGFAQDLTDYDGEADEMGVCFIYGITS